MKIGLISIAIFFLIPMQGFSQNSKLGLEFGLVKSHSQRFISIYNTSYSAHSLISPLVGINWTIDKSNRLEFAFGLHYEMFGTRYKKNNMPTGSYTYIENITFHKLCVPVGIGLKLNNNQKKNYPVLKTGIRPNINLFGRYYNERLDPVSQGFVRQYEFDPLMRSLRFHEAERFSIQGFLGISERLGRSEFSFYFTPGYYLKFTSISPPFTFTRKLWNNEFSLSFVHFLGNRDIKNKQSEKSISHHDEYRKNAIGVYFGYIESNVNYERNVFFSSKAEWKIRAGFGIFTNPDSGGLIWNVYNITAVYLLGKSNSHLELDAGLKYLDLRKETYNRFIPDVFAGYRFEKLSGRYFFRAGLSNVEVITPSFSIGGGIKFN